MSASNTLLTLKNTILDVIYDLTEQDIKDTQTLSDLNAGSIERTEILMVTARAIGLSIRSVTLREVAGLSLQSIADTFDSWLLDPSAINANGR
ncbi:hypothetical protein [Pseudomonas mediterranea]|uniref:hypothetical protein n=1 Tax=Pseudomonas mediterranea TaxID=183795 RepID=UPI0006D8CE70|nr:hypothetical protein [Pseudomonas mediterranea]